MIDISNNSKNQQTIAKSVSINGIGLHSGVDVTMKLYPAEADYGIKFIRKDIKDNNVIEALWSNVSSTKLSTTISNQSGTSVSTIEHLMSALSGLHIDNIKIEIDGPEVPIMDGSSIKFVDLIDQTSTQSLNKRRKILKVKKNIKVENNDSSVELKHQTSSIYFMESNISVLSSKLLIGLLLPLSNLTFSSESTPTTSLSPSDLAYLNNSI